MPEPTITYHRDTLYRELAEVQGYLAELRYIETAMAYLEERDASLWHEVTTGTYRLEVELGRTFPFTKVYEVPAELVRLPWQESNKTEVENQLAVFAEEASSWAATEIETMTGWIEPFTWPQGSLYESECIEPVLAAHVRLEDDVSTDFGKLDHSLGNWEGDAADSFASFFYKPFKDTLESQKRLLLALAGGIASARAIAESTQHSLMNAVHYTREALREQLAACAAAAAVARQEALRDILIITGATTTAFAGIFAGGSLWGVTLAMVAGGAGVASTTIPEDATMDFAIRGSTATELARTLAEAITQIDNNDSQQHEVLRQEVTFALERVETLRGGPEGEDGRLIPIRPQIVDGVDARDFYLP